MKNYLTDKEILTKENFNDIYAKLKSEQYYLLASYNGDFDAFSCKTTHIFSDLTSNYTFKQFLITENFGVFQTKPTKDNIRYAIKDYIKDNYKYFRLIEKDNLTIRKINEDTLNFKNDENYSWGNSIKDFKFANGYILNLHLFVDNNTKEEFYEIRIGNLQDKNNNVLTLYKTTDIVNAYDYFNNFINNIQNVYTFNNN